MKREDLIERLRTRANKERAVPDMGHNAAERERSKLIHLLTEAAAALEAAREDSERLDWLDTQRGDDVQGSYPEEPQLVGHYWSVDGQCTDVRTAIDAAREARNG